jgi:cephalosporin-C deacetylase
LTSKLDEHSFPFDPSYGFDREQLLSIEAPPEPADFGDFWQRRYQRAMDCQPRPVLADLAEEHNGWRVFKLHYRSTDHAHINGWLLLPSEGEVRRGLVIGHGYTGRDAPDTDLPFAHTALLFPCVRGMHLSPYPHTSSDPRWHVLHDIQDRDRYILGGCVDDTWLAVSALLRLRPELKGHIGYLGISFGGGIGALALPWDIRIRRAHLNLPSFGHQPLRLELPSTGSAASVQRFARRHPEVTTNLEYFDAAIAARHIRTPVHCACAGFDPMVAPPCQYAVYNSLAGPKTLFELTAGHFDYREMATEHAQLRGQLEDFFADL